MRGKKLLLTVLSISLLSLALIQPEQAEAQSTPSYSKVVMLTGYKLDPSVPSPASGTLTLTLRDDTLSVKGDFSELEAPYMSGAIYFAQQNRAMNQLFTFDVELNEEGTGGTIKPADNRFRLSDAHKELLKNGELSIRIMSTKYSHGEIGSQIPGG